MIFWSLNGILISFSDAPQAKIKGLRKTAYAINCMQKIKIRIKSLADLDNLPDPDLLANDIIENLEAAVESFKEIMLNINGK